MTILELFLKENNIPAQFFISWNIRKISNLFFLLLRYHFKHNSKSMIATNII